MVVVDDLDKRLDLASFCDLFRSHPSGHLQWIALNTSYESVGERVSFGAGIEWLDNDNLRVWM